MIRRITRVIWCLKYRCDGGIQLRRTDCPVSVLRVVRRDMRVIVGHSQQSIGSSGPRCILFKPRLKQLSVKLVEEPDVDTYGSLPEKRCRLSVEGPLHALQFRKLSGSLRRIVGGRLRRAELICAAEEPWLPFRSCYECWIDARPNAWAGRHSACPYGVGSVSARIFDDFASNGST